MRVVFIIFSALFFHTCYANEINECASLSEITVIPFKGEHVNDEVYNSLIEQGVKSIPCLIEQITNDNVMPDPRKAPPYSGFRVGDLAFFILLDVAGVSLVNFLPEDYKIRYIDEGVYAYFAYVEGEGNRTTIQEKWQLWFLANKKGCLK